MAFVFDGPPRLSDGVIDLGEERLGRKVDRLLYDAGARSTQVILPLS